MKTRLTAALAGLAMLAGAGAALGPTRLQAFARLVIPHQHHAEADVAQAVGEGPAQQFGDGEPFLEVQGLPQVDNVEAAVESVLGEAVVAGRQVAGGVEGAAVGALDEGRLLELLAGQGRQIDHRRALVLFQQALGRQFRQQRAHLVFVVGLALPRIEGHAQQGVDALELAQAGVLEDLPQVAGLGVAVCGAINPVNCPVDISVRQP